MDKYLCLRECSYDSDPKVRVENNKRAIEECRQRHYRLKNKQAKTNVSSDWRKTGVGYDPSESKVNSDGAKKRPSLDDLPKDVAVIILEMCLKQPNGIELCPEPFNLQDQYDESMKRTGCGSEFTSNQETLARHRRVFKQDIAPHMSLLRLSKGWHAMSSEILYGKNQFQFTNEAGWFGLHDFINQIGPANVRKLRDLTVMHPEFVKAPYERSAIPPFLRAMPRIDRRHLGKFGYFNWLHSPISYSDRPDREYWPTQYHILTPRCFPWSPVAALEEAGTLRHLRFLVPGNLAKKEDVYVHDVVDARQFEDLQITIVRKGYFDEDISCDGTLHSQFSRSILYQPRPSGLSAHEVVQRRNLAMKEQQIAQRHLYAEVEIDSDGQYTINAREADSCGLMIDACVHDNKSG